jgi:hypothetical protein
MVAVSFDRFWVSNKIGQNGPFETNFLKMFILSSKKGVSQFLFRRALPNFFCLTRYLWISSFLRIPLQCKFQSKLVVGSEWCHGLFHSLSYTVIIAKWCFIYTGSRIFTSVVSTLEQVSPCWNVYVWLFNAMKSTLCWLIHVFIV